MMTLVGIACGLLCAVAQSFSYLCSAGFLLRYRSSIQLVVFSQLGMGLICLPFTPFLFPRELAGKLLPLLLLLAAWVAVFSIGQFAFFKTQEQIEPSRVSSLLGLKILVLSAISVLLLRQALHPLQWLAVALCSAAACAMNWSGHRGFSLKGLLWLFVALVFYSLTDLAETELVRLPAGRSVIFDAIKMSVVCYALLGLLTLPLLLKFRYSPAKFVAALPFGLCWFLSQLFLFICLGILGAVFGNIIQSSRGLVSIALGMLLARLGHGRLDSEISGRMWRRRLAAAILMAAGIILFSLARLA